MNDHVNLLPIGYRRRCLVRRRLRQWSIAWGLTAVALTAVWLDERARWQAAREDVETNEQRYDQVRSLKNEATRLAAQRQGFGKQEALVSSLQHAPPALLPVALVSASAAGCEGRVAVRHLLYDEVTAPQPLAAPGPAPSGAPPVAAAAVPTTSPPTARITIDGIATDNVAIAEFVLGLRDSGVFQRVDLKSAASSTTRSGNVTAYQVECGL